METDKMKTFSFIEVVVVVVVAEPNIWTSYISRNGDGRVRNFFSAFMFCKKKPALEMTNRSR